MAKAALCLGISFADRISGTIVFRDKTEWNTERACTDPPVPPNNEESDLASSCGFSLPLEPRLPGCV